MDVVIKAVYDRTTHEHLDIGNLNVNTIVSIKKHNNLMCEYECMNCKRLNIVTLNNVSRKFKKNIFNCATCKEYEGLAIKDTKQIKVNLLSRLQTNQLEFENEDDDFKKMYFRKHLTIEEFERIRERITSFQHDKFDTLSNFVYFPCVKIPNQTQYNPYLYDKTRDVLEKIIYIHFKCECCECVFFNRDLYIQKNKLKLLCNECNFTNNVFNIRSSVNFNNEKLVYKSKVEKKLIDFCNNNGIIITNGPYSLNGLKKYKVDFHLPSLNVLIMMCKNDKQQLCNGKLNNNELLKHYNEIIMISSKSFVEKTNYILKLTNKI